MPDPFINEVLTNPRLSRLLQINPMTLAMRFFGQPGLMQDVSTMAVPAMENIAQNWAPQEAALTYPLEQLAPTLLSQLQRTGVDKLINRVIDTTKPSGELADYYLGSAAVDRGKSLETYHVTDNPSPVQDRLKSGQTLREGRKEGKYGDYGTGLYGSAAPELWMGRAQGKWSFLKDLDQHKRMELAEKILDAPGAQRGYVTQIERENLQRWMNEYVQTGNPNLAVFAAEQPYNISFWKPEFLKEVGLEQKAAPKIEKMNLQGRFAKLEGQPTQEEAMAIKNAGFDGAFVSGGFGHYPQIVVWNNDAVKKFGIYEQFPDASVTVTVPKPKLPK